MLDSLLNYLQNIKIDEGVQTRALDPPIHKNRGHKQLVKRKSPLQYACSLGLYTIVDRLLQEGANPDGLNGVDSNPASSPFKTGPKTFEQAVDPIFE